MASYKLDQLFARCKGAYSDKTVSGYRRDLLTFQRWCLERDLDWAPAEPETVAAFIDDQARSLAIATVTRRLGAIKFAHRMLDLPSPAGNSAVRLAVRRVARSKPSRPRHSHAMTVSLLHPILDTCPDTLAGRRDAALVSVGYDTLCRSVELCAMRVEHLASDHATILVPRAKADPFGHGRLAYLSPATQARLARWLEAGGVTQGPLFQGLHTLKLSGEFLSTASIRRIVKRAAERARLGREAAEGLSGHSMRIGAAQDMMVAGIDHLAIMQAGGWKSINVLARYVESASADRIHMLRWQKLGMLRS